MYLKINQTKNYQFTVADPNECIAFCTIKAKKSKAIPVTGRHMLLR
jgi:hypothetical protein